VVGWAHPRARFFAGRVPLVAACFSLGKSCPFVHELDTLLWLCFLEGGGRVTPGWVEFPRLGRVPLQLGRVSLL
jgi:hypothetical protein